MFVFLCAVFVLRVLCYAFCGLICCVCFVVEVFVLGSVLFSLRYIYNVFYI